MRQKLIIAISITLSSLLIVSVILFSILQTNTKPNLPNPDAIDIYNQSVSSTKSYKSDSEEYKQIIKLYNKMFEKTYIKQIGDKEILKNTISEDTNSPTWTDNNKETGLYMEFSFNSAKKFIVYRNGSSRRVDLRTIIFRLNKEDKTQQLLIYFKTAADIDAENNKENNNTIDLFVNYPLNTQANTHELYNYILTLIQE